MFYTVLWIFMIYSVFGWGIEVAFHAVTLGKVVNRGFLNGPLCPVYGCGILTVFAVMRPVCALLKIDASIETMPIPLLLLIGTVFATLVELVSGWLLYTFFHARWWDYRDRPFNLNGYICLEFSLIWGLGIAFVLRVIHPGILRFIDRFPYLPGVVLMAVSYLIFFADLVLTVMAVLKMNRQLARMQELQKAIHFLSDGMSEVIGNTTLKTMEKVEDGKQLADDLIEESVQKAGDLVEGYRDAVEAGRSELEDKRAEFEAALLHMQNSMKYHRLFGVGRILSAAPKKGFEKYQDMVDAIKKYVV